MLDDEQLIQITAPATNTLIKVIGVGGGGGNAIANMYRDGMYDVSFLVCNTDSKALEDSPIPTRIQFGPGLGAGGKPEIGRQYAEQEESLAAIYDAIDKETKMVFVTAGMGGGTGTGAAPIVAREVKARDILTVGIVTLPFLFEGRKQIDKALDGLELLAKEVDALIVVNNQRMLSVYHTQSVMDAFHKADQTLTNAVRSVVDIIKMRGVIYLDFNDVCMVLREGGICVISTGTAHGENRITAAIENALNSPLLNQNDIFTARRLVMCITFPEKHETLQMNELCEVEEFIAKFERKDLEYKWGLAKDESLEGEVKVTILASGFGLVEEEEDEEQLLKRIERETLHQTYYGELRKTTKKPRRPVYIFSQEELDNELLIDQIEAIPTAKRTREQLQKIKEFSQNPIP
ncbi:MAG: cell division protein FtsZ [Bacteroidaceae bacterium]|nr:cell division protein FtsZ [Bacteroidaceae bacterium]